MKKKILLIIFGIVFIIGCSTLVYFKFHNNNKEIISVDQNNDSYSETNEIQNDVLTETDTTTPNIEKTKEKENTKNESKKTNTNVDMINDVNTNEEKKTTTDKNTTKEENTTSNQSSNTNNNQSNTSNNESSNNTTNDQTTNSKETKNESNSSNQEVTPTTPSEDTSKNNPWDYLGISEYDYYNKPMYSYMKIDYNVGKYGSREATEKACRDESQRLFEEENIGSSCQSVLSYSGRYLGEYFKYT